MDLENRLQFTASCKETLEARFEFVKFSDHRPLN